MGALSHSITRKAPAQRVYATLARQGPGDSGPYPVPTVPIARIIGSG
jgi:hypothetical protein